MLPGRILKPIVLISAAAVLVLAIVATFGCGGDDDQEDAGPAATQTQPGSGSGQEEGGGSGGQSAAGSAGAGEPGGGGETSADDTGGATPPRSAAPRKKSLLRFLASRYRQSPWYPLMRKLEVNGGHVRVHLNFSPDSDDEGPPVLACTAVLSYGSQVRDVTVYASPTSQGQTEILRQC